MGNIEQYLAPSVSIKVCSWKKTSLELHGFSSADYNEHNLTLTGTSVLCFSEVGCYLRKEGETEGDVESSCQVEWREGTTQSGTIVVRCFDEAWIPLKDSNYLLETGMQIRFGRSRYYVEEINLSPAQVLETVTGEVSLDSQTFENVCRICLSGTNTEKNPLVEVCKCTGTTKWIHAKCAEALILNKLKTSASSIVDSYNIQQVVRCDLCLGEIKLPEKERSQEPFGNSLRPVGAYLKLVRVGDPREFHYLHPGLKQWITIGRARTSDLKLLDASISRIHATLLRTESGFSLHDEGSKFGTLVRAPSEVPLPYDHEVALSIRQSLIRFKAVRPSRLLQCCCHCCLHKPQKVTPVECVTEPSTKRHEELPFSQQYLFP